jgi:hypothetical protein
MTSVPKIRIASRTMGSTTTVFHEQVMMRDVKQIKHIYIVSRDMLRTQAKSLTPLQSRRTAAHQQSTPTREGPSTSKQASQGPELRELCDPIRCSDERIQTSAYLRHPDELVVMQNGTHSRISCLARRGSRFVVNKYDMRGYVRLFCNSSFHEY